MRDGLTLQDAPAARPSRMARALREASFAGLIAAILSFPILAIRVESDMNNRLVLEERWHFLGVAALAIFIARFLASMLDDWRARGLAIAGAWGLLFAIGLQIFPDRPQSGLVAWFAGGGALML
ncbi:MAG: DUF3382 domain-containing protein, partial [Beijerinckiaceae bacterium]|nr:DUF3382 domain-containing protein [Beijerinckiaceae bacterium]